MILVVGGTGRLGGQIVEQLRDAHPVRVMTRDPGRASARHEGVEVVQGDLRDRDSVERALRGVTAVVCTAHGSHSAGDNGPRRVDGVGIAGLIDVAAASRVRQFVYVSSTSAREDSPAEFFRLKAGNERRLSATGIPHSILRPTHLMDTWARVLGEPLVKQERMLVLGGGRNPVSFVDVSDVASVAAQLAPRDGDGLRLDLGGPEALTLSDVNELLRATFGVAPRRTTRLSAGMLRLASRLTRPFNEVASRQMLFGALLDTQPQVVDSTSSWRRFDIRPASFTEWLHRHQYSLAAEWGSGVAGHAGGRVEGL